MLVLAVNSIPSGKANSHASKVQRMSKARKPVEPWQAEDAARLKRRFKEKWKGSQEEFGNTSGLGGQAGVWQYLNARIPLNLRAAAAFSAGLGIPISDFSPRLAAELAKAAIGAVGQAVVPTTGSPGVTETLSAREKEVLYYIRNPSPRFRKIAEVFVDAFRALETGQGVKHPTRLIDSERASPKHFKHEGVGRRGRDYPVQTSQARKLRRGKGAARPPSQGKNR